MFELYYGHRPLAQTETKIIRDRIDTELFDIRKRRRLPPALHHYTNSTGLKGIIESGSIRATHVSFMNDTQEYLLAVELLLGEVRKRLASTKEPIKKDLLKEMETPLAETQSNNVAPCFVTCFSAKGNDLNQWRSYGNGEGGFSLGFAPADLEKNAKLSSAFLAPVIYGHDQQLSIVKSTLAWALEEYPRHARKNRKRDIHQHRDSWVRTLFLFASQLASLMKSSSFSDEHEWRLVHLAELPCKVEFLPKPTGLSAYVSLNIGTQQAPKHLPLKNVWSGPGQDREISLMAAQILLKKACYKNVAFEASDISYRVA